MYQRIMVALDGSVHSNFAEKTAISLGTKLPNVDLFGVHVYASELHRVRFEQMEPGLPGQYQQEEKLAYLRETHDQIIDSGMHLISDAYLANLANESRKGKFTFHGLTPEGRNYVELINLVKANKVDLLICGALGQGIVAGDRLGSLSERSLLTLDECDVLLIRESIFNSKKPILVGIDGSDSSFYALDKAIGLSKITGSELITVAVYDPFFHKGVFQSISKILPGEDAKRFNFAAQEELHDEIIDKGLENLYRQGLERSVNFAKDRGVVLRTEILSGKVYDQIIQYAKRIHASLIVLGRDGLHYQEQGIIGYNTLQVARNASGSVLIVHKVEGLKIPQSLIDPGVDSIVWQENALELLNNIPGFARGMAKKAIAQKAKEAGMDIVTVEFVKASKNKFMRKD